MGDIVTIAAGIGGTLILGLTGALYRRITNTLDRLVDVVSAGALTMAKHDLRLENLEKGKAA